jgi:hypothetical protein
MRIGPVASLARSEGVGGAKGSPRAKPKEDKLELATTGGQN